MFYSHFVYIREGPLAKIWLASHILRNLKTKDITSLDITQGAKVVMGRGVNGKSQNAPFALRICGQLLYGLVRIYQRKVELTVDEAEKIKYKLDSANRTHAKNSSSASVAMDDDGVSIAESAKIPRSARKSLTAAKLELTSKDLRGRDHAIMLPDIIHDDLSYANLGEGLDELEVGRDGFTGTEWNGPLDSLGAPHAVFNLKDMNLQMTGESGQAISMDGSDFMDIDMPLDEEEINVFSQSQNKSKLDISAMEEGRATAPELLKAPDISVASVGKDLDDFGAGGGTQFEDDGFLPGPGSVAGDAKSVMDLEAEISLAKNELSTLQIEKKQKKKPVQSAAARRRANGYQPVMDEVTEIPQHEFKRWLGDPSDLIVQRGGKDDVNSSFNLSQPRSAIEQIEQVQAEIEMNKHQGFSSSSSTEATHAPQHLFDLPATGLGSHTLLPSYTSYLRHSHITSDIGRFAPSLLGLLQGRFNVEMKVKGLKYRLEDEEAAAATAAEGDDDDKKSTRSGRHSLLPEGDMMFSEGLDDIQMADFGTDAFSPDIGTAQDEQQYDEDGNLIAPEELFEEEKKDDEIEDDKQDNSSEFGFPLDLAPDASASEIRQNRAANDSVEFWKRIGGSKTSLKEHAASGWSQRTKLMHTKLKEEFKTTKTGTEKKPYQHETLMKGHYSHVAASTFYQLLVLAGGNYIKVKQETHFGPISIIKAEGFDNKVLPSVPASSETQTQKSMQPEDSQQSMEH